MEYDIEYVKTNNVPVLYNNVIPHRNLGEKDGSSAAGATYCCCVLSLTMKFILRNM